MTTTTTTNHHRAVVVGASMAGLCAARVLADRFERVVVVDRDELAADPARPRRRVPQGRHPHLLHVAGARLLERWFPGVIAELYRGGALEIDLVADFAWHQSGGLARRPASDLKGPVMSRPFLEAAIRERLTALSNVEVRDGCTVDGVEIRDGRLVAVRVDGRPALPADLTVDATGRQASSLAWLEAAGFAPPPIETVEVDTRYVTCAYRRRPDPDRDWQAAAVIDDPETKRLAMALPAEGDRWLIMLGGLNGEVPPVHESERLAWAKGLPSPLIADLMAAAEPLGEAVTHRFTANQRRRLDRLRRFPLGWIVLGDAVCSFDPIYGQGMTSAALQAEVLAACLEGADVLDRSFSRRYFRAVSKVVAAPWSVAVGGDFAYPGTTGRKPPGTDLTNRYMRRVNIAVQHDDEVAVRFNEVAAMVRKPEALLRPGIALRVWRSSRTKRTASARAGAEQVD